MLGYNPDRFIKNDKLLDNVIKAYKCAICSSVSRDPLTFYCCKQICCADCIKNSLKNSKLCPNCRQSIRYDLLSRVAQPFSSLLDELQIKCNYESYGCQHVCEVSKLEQHSNFCLFKPRIWSTNGTNLKKADIFDKVFSNKKIKAKLLFISQCYWTENHFALFLSTEESFLGFGENDWGQLGQGNTEKPDDFVELKDLSGKEVTEIFEGNSCMFARISDGSIYSWGGNNWGQLGRGFISSDTEYFKPEKVNFNQKSISQIRCGDLHNIGLTSEGSIYSWGENKLGQLGYGNLDQINCEPKLIQFESDIKVQYIYCFAKFSFAISSEQKVYFWGENTFCLFPNESLVINRPKIVDQFSADRVVADNDDIFYILDGKLFMLRKLNCYDLNPDDVWDICIDFNDNLLAQNRMGVWKLDDEATVMTKTNQDNFYQYYLNEYQTSFGTIVFVDEFCLEEKINYNNEDMNSVESLPSLIREENNSEELISGISFKYYDKENDKNYVIEKIHVGDKINHIFHELLNLRELVDDRVVQIQKFYIDDSCLYLMSDYYSQNLKDILSSKAQAFGRQRREKMTSLEFFLSFHILKELTDCLNYLHSLKPRPITHRDMKPSNVLVSNGSDRRFLMLSDIGLGQKIESSETTTYYSSIGFGYRGYTSEQAVQRGYQQKDSGLGTSIASSTSNYPDWFHCESLRYRAPEVIRGGFYSTKADVFSLGMIGLDLFGMETIDNLYSRKYLSLYKRTIIQNSHQKIIGILAECLSSGKCNDRPDCQSLLLKFEENLFDKNTLHEMVTQNTEISNEFADDFFNSYIKSKLV